MNSYALAFGILGSAIFFALVMWSRPVIKRRLEVRRFRKDLRQVETVSLGWADALRHQQNPSDLPRRSAERGRAGRQPDDGGEALV